MGKLVKLGPGNRKASSGLAAIVSRGDLLRKNHGAKFGRRAFGSSSDIRTKERVVLQLLKQYEGEVAYINVRTVDNPTWRSVK